MFLLECIHATFRLAKELVNVENLFAFYFVKRIIENKMYPFFLYLFIYFIIIIFFLEKNEYYRIWMQVNMKENASARGLKWGLTYDGS